MIQESPGPCFPSTTEPEGLHHTSQLYHDLMDPGYGGADPAAVGPEIQLRSILCSLTILKQKAHEVETLISMFLSQESPHQVEPFASVGTLIQEIVANASSMMFNCQQMTIGSPQGGTNNSNSHSANDTHMQGETQNQHIKFQRSNNNVLLSDFVGCGIGKINTNQEFIEGDGFYNWYNNDNNNNTTCNNYINLTRSDSCSRTTTSTKGEKSKAKERKSQLQETYDLVEPEAADLLAKYTHYCHVCGKWFKRDANLRMHMRAHGDEYKSSAALSNPLKKDSREGENEMKPPRKYSCPQQGCRWNKNHAKFQPLKSIICVKNHYKRTHCPKMYVCKRCNRKHFSVLSDLRTHEKHCGDRKWLCSCGTTFSRKDKLMGHVSLFVGHTPIVTQLGDAKLDNHGEIQIHFEDRC